MANVKVIDRGYNAAIKIQTQMNGVTLEVGIFDPELAEIAIFNEFGTSNAPPRSFIRSTFDAKRDEFGRRIEEATKKIYATRKLKALGDVGAWLAQSMQRTIDAGVPPPNAESTVKAKGHGHTLINTGAMRAALTFKVESKDSGLPASDAYDTSLLKLIIKGAKRIKGTL